MVLSPPGLLVPPAGGLRSSSSLILDSDSDFFLPSFLPNYHKYFYLLYGRSGQATEALSQWHDNYWRPELTTVSPFTHLV